MKKQSDSIAMNAYEYEDRLIQVALPGTTVQYEYNTFGRRLLRTMESPE
jgi:YD repeat-containing protein